MQSQQEAAAPQSSTIEENFDKLFQDKRLYNRTAPDGNKYKPSYAEVKTVRALVFVERGDGTLVADITETDAYHYYYTGYGKYKDVLEKEMRFIGQYLGIRFDDATNFRGELIISDPSSIAVLRDAGVVVEKPTATATTMSASSRLFDVAASKPAGVDLSLLDATEKKLQAQLEALRAQEKILLAQIEKFSKFRSGPVFLRLRGELLLPQGIKTPLIVESFFELADLMHSKLCAGPCAEWYPESNIVKIALAFDAITGDIHKEVKDASSFLHAMGLSATGETEGCYTYNVTQKQFDDVIHALKVVKDKTPKEIKEISEGHVNRGSKC